MEDRSAWRKYRYLHSRTRRFIFIFWVNKRSNALTYYYIVPIYLLLFLFSPDPGMRFAFVLQMVFPGLFFILSKSTFRSLIRSILRVDFPFKKNANFKHLPDLIGSECKHLEKIRNIIFCIIYFYKVINSFFFLQIQEIKCWIIRDQQLIFNLNSK